MNRARLYGHQVVRASFRQFALIFLIHLAIFSASANLLWTAINGSSYPQLTVPGKVVLAWQLPGPNLIENGSFDASPTNGWTIETTEGTTWRWVRTPGVGTTNWGLSFNLGGSFQSRLFGSLNQVVTIPEEAESAILSWRELGIGFHNPISLRIEVRTLDDMVMLSQPARPEFTTSSAMCADLSRFAGQTIKIVFLVEGESGVSAPLDDIRLSISPVAEAEFDVYLGPTAKLNSSHLLGQTTELRWDATDRAQGGLNYWRVDVRSGGQVATGMVWSFSHSTQMGRFASELLLRNAIPAPMIDERIALDAVMTDEIGRPSTQKPSGSALLNTGLAAPGIRAPSICITELQFGSTNGMEFMNVSSNEVDISGWKIVVHVSESPSGTFTNTLPGGTKVPAGEVLLLLPGSPAPGIYPLLLTGRSSNQGMPRAVALFDAAGNTVDFVHLLPSSPISPQPTELWVPSAQSVENWLGEPAFAPEPSRSLLRIGGSDRNDRIDWVIGTNSLGAVNTGLVHPFSPGVAVLSGSHRTFTNANATAWTGTLSSSEPATNVFLVARYRTFHGRQGPFEITALPRAEMLLPEEIAENSPEPLIGSVRLKTAMSEDVRAAFISPAGRLGLPAEVVIPAGSLEAPFQFSAIDNNAVSGPIRARISLQSDQIHAIGSILVLDDEKPALTLDAPVELDENGNAEASVQLDAPLAFDLQLQIRSDFSPVLEHPYSVTIPAGQTNAVFSLYSPEDSYLSGPKEVTLRALVAGWLETERSIVITDNEPKTFSLSTTSQRYPEIFYQLAAMTIELGGVAASDVPLTIHSSDRTELAPATNAVIRAGSSRVGVTFHLTGDDLKDGTQPVNLTVSSPGFEPVSVALEITDDDPATFEVGVTSATKFQGVPFMVGFRAIDINGSYIDSFAGSAALTASNHAGAVTLSPSETGPFAHWGATVEARIDQPGERFWIAAETNGAPGVSPPFRILPSPLYKTIALAACDLRMTADRSNLVASASESDVVHPNSILIIDPATTEILRTFTTRRLVGRDKAESLGVDGQLALSDDGSFIFIITENGTMVQQFGSQNGVFVREFGLGTNEFGASRIASTIEAVPGRPDQVAIGQVDGWSERSTRIYDRGTPLPGTAPFAMRMMLRAAPERSYLSFDNSLWSASLEETGFSDVQQFPRPGDFAFWTPGDVQLRNGLVHFLTGVVYDPGNQRLVQPYSLHRSHYPRDLIGTFDFDTNRHRAFFITPRANGGQMLDLFDMPTRQMIRRIELGMILGYVTRLYYLGDALAAMDNAGVYFFRSSMFEPVGAPVTVVLSRQTTNPIANAGRDFSYSLSITNQGTNGASEITLDETLPAGVALVSAHPSLGRLEKNERGLRWIVDDLPAGAMGVLQITIRPAHGGTFTIESSLASYEWNTSASQLLRTELNVQLGLSQNAYSHFPLGARAIAHDKTRELVYASISPGIGPFAEKIVEIEPASGRIVGAFEVGPSPDLIAVSDQDQFLWVVSNDRRRVRRYSLSDKVKEVEFLLRAHGPTPTFSSPIYDTAIAIEPVPGQPRSLAILQLRIYEGSGTGGGGIAIYDHNVLRPLVGLETPDEFITANQIIFHPSEPILFGIAPYNEAVEIFQMTTEGVRFQQRLGTFQTFGHPGLAVTGGELVAGDGAVLKVEGFTKSGYITNSTGQKMISSGAGTVTLHPGNRVSFASYTKTYFAELSTRTQIGSIDLPLGLDYPIETLAIGDQLVLLLTSGSIYFVRSEHLAAAEPKPPTIEPTLDFGTLIIRVESRPGLKYQLQSASTLPGQWSDLDGPKTGNGDVLEFPGGQPSGRHNFYRLKIEQE